MYRHGKRSQTLLPDGTRLDYHYHSSGQLSQLAINQQPVLWRNFDAAGREIHREYASGLQQHQAFNAFSQLTEQRWQGFKTEEIATSRERHYHYSSLDQLTAVQDSQEGDTRYQYNAIDQLIAKEHSQHSSQNESLQWDSFGNPVGEGIELQQDRLTRYHAHSYQYDASGNQIVVIHPQHSQRREFNGFNQLLSLSHKDGLSRYEYDALGRRSAKITSQGRIDYLWDGDTLLGECQNGDFSWYIFEPGTHRPLFLIKHGELYSYQLDQLGTPLSLTDSNNQIVWQAQYSSFGKATITVNALDNPIRFQGQYYDNESGLHYNHFRYYDPNTGRFISQDPIGLLGGINHYQYAPNHINWVDPLGLCAKEDLSIDPQPPGTPYKLDSNGRWHDKSGKFCSFSWPAHDGFATSQSKVLAELVTLSPGVKLDRYGGYFNANGQFVDTGRYFSDEGIEFEKRALPPKSKTYSPHTFEVVEPFDVLAGPIAPWFGQPGGGTQYFVAEEHGGVDGLIASGKIKRTSEIPKK